ncbi:Arabinogalactan peptide, AGP [Parasponia andersonii]|uniref:Arabinogalactan peptide, AGP n=1 Tax=Parasponia andersonii TaxID=3476 RepID=A0A2P5DDA7_PARAD|nr:Arabinogalactan peptide, AGP [Parasponia andersonii]
MAGFSSSSSRGALVGVLAFFFALAFAIAHAESSSPGPAPAPTSDGTSIDQGIAYVLMLVALVLTYLIHPLDESSSSFFF